MYLAMGPSSASREIEKGRLPNTDCFSIKSPDHSCGRPSRHMCRKVWRLTSEAFTARALALRPLDLQYPSLDAPANESVIVEDSVFNRPLFFCHGGIC